MKSPQALQLKDPSASPRPPTLYYEPTSVLDPHLTSSPASGGGNGANLDLQPLPWDLLPPPAPRSDEWDPVSDWLLSDKDDFPPHLHPHAVPNHSFDLSFERAMFEVEQDNQNQNQYNTHSPPQPSTFDRGHLDLLIRAAHAVETGDLNTAHTILARLNQQLPSGGGPLQRAAFHFRDALLALLPISNPPTAEPPLSALELVRRIAANKAHSDLSPVPQFAGFSANQTLLEAMEYSTALHLIDFELGLGGQWSSFTQEIAARSRAARRSPPPIRLTAVVSQDSPEAALAAENLRDFARGLGVRLSVDFVRVGGLGALSLAGVRLGGGEVVGVVLTPSVFRVLGGSTESDAALLRFVRRASPKVVVFIDNEPTGYTHQPSFRRSFTAGLEFYAAVMESIDAAAVATAAGEEVVRRVETSVIRPRVFAAVASCGERSATWRETFMAAGMTPAPFSEFTESQAEWLLRRAPVEGYGVARQEGAMVLSWRGRELAATSAWRC